MKEFCSHNCCATKGAKYITPWCDLLAGEDSSCSVLHLWYNLDMLQEEIEKRTSILGKLRRTEEAQHLLDLISMTEDEKPMFMPFAKAAMADVYEALNAYMPKYKKALWWREGQETVTIDDDESGSGDDEPISFRAEQYVIYNGQLYIAIADGDSDDISGKLVPTEDYRNSIHYGILWRCDSNINAVEPLDTAIFEALVARIIYKWLQYSYPEEAARYFAEWTDNIESIRHRARLMEGAHIINCIPRTF